MILKNSLIEYIILKNGVNFPNNYKEMACHTMNKNMTFSSRKTKIIFSSKTYPNNLCFIYIFEKSVFTVY